MNSSTRLYPLLISLLVLFLTGCAGTVSSYVKDKNDLKQCKKAYIIKNEFSTYIKPVGMFNPEMSSDGVIVTVSSIGNIDLIIKEELTKYGINAQIGGSNDIPDDIDFIVRYRDVWRWDFKKILDEIDIYLWDAKDNKIIARGRYNIKKIGNKVVLHAFPTPEREIPKILKDIFNNI